MATNLNIDMLFKKYSEYFVNSQTASTHRQNQEKPSSRANNNGLKNDHPKSQTLKLKPTKTLKSKIKIQNKDALTDTKKTKSGVSTKATPRCPTNKHHETKVVKVEQKTHRSITPDRVPRKSLSKTPFGIQRKVGEKDKQTIKLHKQNKQRNQRSKSRQFPNLLTDRSVKMKTQRSKSRDNPNTDKTKNTKSRARKVAPNPHKIPKYPQYSQYPHYTLHTEYLFDRQSLQQSFGQQKVRYNIPERDKLRNQQLFYEQEQYQSPQLDCERYLKIPMISSREERASLNERQEQQSESQFKEEYYKQLIEKIKEEQELKWRRTVSILKEYREVGDMDMLEKIINESEENRKSINHNSNQSHNTNHDQNKEQTYQKYRSLYDEDHPVSYSSPKEKVSYIRSREASSKKLMEDLQQAHLNQIQLQTHFSSNKSIKDSSCKKLPFLINREEKRELVYDNKQSPKGLEEELVSVEKSHHGKEENLLLSIHNVNIEEYLLSQSKKSESSRHDSPQFEKIESREVEEDESQENSLIEFIQNQLQEVREEKKEEESAISNAVFQQVLESEIRLFGQEMMGVGEILHAFLTYTNREFTAEEPQKPVQISPVQEVERIECSNTFILQLVRSFIEYIEKHMLEEFNKSLTVPFGEKPLKMLRFMRESGENEENEGGYQSIIPVSLFIEFQPTLKDKVEMSSSLEQYFFNHCIFDSVNENLDKLRPFGLKGLPPLCFQTHFSPIRFESVHDYLLINTRSILSFGIGRDIDDCEEDDAFKIIDNTFRRLDKLILSDTEQEWKDNNDLEFELKYDLSVAIIEWVIRDEAKSLLYLIL